MYKKMVRVSVILSLLALMLSLSKHSPLLALVVGSDTAVSRQTSLLTFPQADSNNEMRGFTSVEAGFTLESATTTCTFNAFLPVSGDVTVNDGYLYLNKDLLFANTMRFMNGGYVRGNSRVVQLPKTSSNMTLPISPGVVIFDSVTLDLNSNIVLGGLWRIRGSCKIVGNGKQVVLGTGSFVIELGASAQLEFQDVFLTGVGSSNLRCISSNGTITFCDSAVSLARDFTFSTGALIFKNDVVVTGTSIFNYQSATASTISSGATLYLDNGVTFNYAPSIASKNLLVMSDATSGLYLDGASLFCTSTGLRLSTGTLYIDNKVTLSSQALNSGQAMELNSNVNIQALAGSVLDVFGFVKYV